MCASSRWLLDHKPAVRMAGCGRRPVLPPQCRAADDPERARARQRTMPQLVNFYRDWLVDHENCPIAGSPRARSTCCATTLAGQHPRARNLVQRLLIVNRGEEVAKPRLSRRSAQHRWRPEGRHQSGVAQSAAARRARSFEREYLEYHLTPVPAATSPKSPSFRGWNARTCIASSRVSASIRDCLKNRLYRN